MDALTGRVKTVSPHQQTLGRNIARLRTAAKLTQERLAERAAINPRYLQKLEAGHCEVSLAVLMRLRRALNRPWQAILRGIN
jgi:transcriptional regulator with XRE-family HTH domain